MTSKADEAAAAEAAAKAAEAGAGESQADKASIAKLTTERDAANLLVTERDSTIETHIKSIDELTSANNKFAGDAVSSTDMAKQLKDSQDALEESRKAFADQQVLLETSNTTNSGLQSQMLTTRRDALVSKYGMDVEKVAALDDVGLSALESTLPGAQLATSNGGNNSGKGLGLDGSGPGSVDVNSMTERERLGSIIESLKPKT